MGQHVTVEYGTMWVQHVTVEYGTIDGSAKGGVIGRGGVDYEESQGVLQFPRAKQVVSNNTGTKNLLVTLRNPSIGAKIGKNSAVMVTITTDPLAERLARVMADEEEVTWGGQFKRSVEHVVVCDLRGAVQKCHGVCCLACALRTFLGAWPTFITSLIGIGILTALVEQLGNLLSCVVGLKASLAGITIIALGTSLPDTFASRTAALHDEYADAAIGNITGSNSVNVFLGLGLPWVIKAMYKVVKKKKFTVSTNNLVQSVVVFVIVGSICLIVLELRRKADVRCLKVLPPHGAWVIKAKFTPAIIHKCHNPSMHLLRATPPIMQQGHTFLHAPWSHLPAYTKFVGGELGGKNKTVKALSATFMVFLWVIYIALSSIKAYHPDVLPW
ncbi:hypothetical protein NP493_1010g00018 [Ridgeia piscesae]|uniref:Sodium/calcium exchanger membrane region domain-containing protein n=1 Tax=Ridgeia piscesae TaxID=27915 RepID=A0AAD9KHZ3_RIDPI|nr:hypothetical protein NP493_1010g00018 [Ridgeia piscesae]